LLSRKRQKQATDYDNTSRPDKGDLKMRVLGNVRMLVGGLLGALVFLASGNAQAQQEWGTIKGQVIFGGNAIPKPAVLLVNKDGPACLAKGPLLSEDWVIDPETKGIKWVYVWLVPDSRDKKDLVKPIPINPKLLGKKLDNIVIDQPCCLFEPYAVALQQGQSITVKNSMGIAHNSKIDGDAAVGNPQTNPLIPPGGMINVGPFNAQATEIPLSCSIHGWMSGHIRVFSHPYFCITGKDGKFEIKDAPAGQYRLVILHPGSGWVVGDKEPDKFGIQINIKPNTTTDLGQFKVKAP
jgi:hypothetical protein